MKASQIMNRDLLRLNPKSTIRDAARIMNQLNLGCLVIQGDDGLISGVVHDRCFTKVVALNIDPDTVPAIKMDIGHILVCAPDDDLAVVCNLLTGSPTAELIIVIDDHTPVGYIWPEQVIPGD